MGPKSDGHACPYIELNGVKYRLASIPSSPESKARLMAPSFADAMGILPESDWKLTDDFQAMFPYVMDQKSHGSCVGHGAAGALMRSRDAQGMAHVDLSGTFVYSYINGNRDNGAMISDAVGVLTDKGTCTYAKCPWDTIYQRNISDEARAEAQRFKALEIYAAGKDPWGEMGTGVTLGFVPVYAVMVGNSFMDTDSDGVCGVDRGPGNHCVHGKGLKKRSNGEMLLELVNSWGRSFGSNGRAYVTRKHIESVQQDWYLIRAAADDPQDPNAPPSIVK